jgi:hypothetical protein
VRGVNRAVYDVTSKPPGKLTLTFDSLPFVGLGADVEGRTVNSNLEIVHDGRDHEFIRQYWTRADGTGRRWLAVQYEYRR